MLEKGIKTIENRYKVQNFSQKTKFKQNPRVTLPEKLFITNLL